MILEHFGHAALGLTARLLPVAGHRILFDPYEPGGFGGLMGYPPIDFDPDDLLITHDHLDHCHAAPFGRARVFFPQRDQGDAEIVRALSIRSLKVDHDAWLGRLRGGSSWMLRVIVDGLSVVHTGDIGALPEPDALDALNEGEPVDVLLLACGGYYTIGPAEAHELALRLQARLIVPIHFGTGRCALPHLAPVDDFLARGGRAAIRREGAFELLKGEMPPAGTVLVFEDQPSGA